MAKTSILLGMGNPLLDISAPVDTEFLAKYPDVKMGNAILADPEKHLPIYEQLAAMDKVEYIAGGSTQNTIRIAQWMLGDEAAGSTAFIGCVGKDEYGKKLAACMEKDGVKPYYMVDEKTATGTCAVLVNDKERSLVANLSAANNYKIDHLKTVEGVLEAAKVVYIAGFFTTVSPDSIMHVAKHCDSNGKKFMMNLSAPFIMQVPPFKKALEDALPYTDIIFGNETEATTFGEAFKYEEKTVEEIAKKMSTIPMADSKKKRTVIITQGCDPVVVAINGKIQKFDVPKIAKEAIVDTNGAGDAFVGGFLAAYLRCKDMETCCAAGNYCAGQIIQTSGCQASGKPAFTGRYGL